MLTKLALLLAAVAGTSAFTSTPALAGLKARSAQVKHDRIKQGGSAFHQAD
jgi:hypothetical protein